MERQQYEHLMAAERKHWWFCARREVVLSVMKAWMPAGELGLLDVGSGTGAMIPVLSEFGNVIVSEPDSETLAWSQEAYGPDYPDVRFLKGAWMDLELSAHSMDVVTAFDVLEHCENDLAALKHWQNWIKPGGKMVLTVPAFQCLWGINDEVSHHYRRYNRSQLMSALEACGLTVEKISYMNCALFLPVWFSRAILDPVRKQQLKERALATSDFRMPPDFLNAILRYVFAMEKHWVPSHALPWGTSLLAVARVNCEGM